MDSKHEATANAWLRTNGANLKCPACGVTNWKAVEFVKLPVHHYSFSHFGPTDIVLVAAACQDCGFTHFISATVMGFK